MHRPRLNIFVLAALCAITGAAQAQSGPMPGRRAGMWEMSMSGGGMQGHGMKMRQCVSPATERAFSPFEHGPPGRRGSDEANCTKRDVHRVAGGWAFESVCLRNGKTVTTTGTLTGDFQTHYRMDVVSRGGEGPQHMTMDNTWVGPCPAAGRGNTVTLPDGRVISIPRQR